MQVHDYIQKRSHDSFDIQNIVLQGMAKINPVTDYDELPAIVEQLVEEVWNDWSNTVLDQLIVELEILRETVPNEIQQCIDKSVGEFSEEAAVIRGTLELC